MIDLLRNVHIYQGADIRAGKDAAGAAQGETIVTVTRRRSTFPAVTAAIVVGGILLALGYLLSNRTSITARQSAMREQGFPVTLAELDAWYALPPGAQNAAPLFLEVFPLFEATHSGPFLGGGENPPASERLDSETLAVMAENREALLGAIERLKNIDPALPCRFPIDLTQGTNTDLPHLASLRQSARLLHLEAAYCAAMGDSKGAAEALRTICAVTQSLDQEPLLISQLVRIACIGLLFEASERVFNEAPPDASGREALRLALGRMTKSDGMVRALAGERCSALSGPAAGLLRGGDAGELLDGVDRLIAAAQGPPWVAVQVYHEWGTEKADAGTLRTGLAPVSTLVLPGLARGAEADVRARAHIALLETALALEEHNEKNGAYPESLSALAGQAPADPYTGRPLQYHRLGEGYKLYSVGPNLVDDGGQPFEKPASGDLVFTVRR